MKEIGANLLLAEYIGRAHVVGREPADCLDVDVPGPLSKTGKPHVVDHTLTQRGHGRSPFEFRRQELCPGHPSRYTSPQPSTTPPPTAKPFSPTVEAGVPGYLGCTPTVSGLLPPCSPYAVLRRKPQ